jgi:hypothetical protein
MVFCLTIVHTGLGSLGLGLFSYNLEVSIVTGYELDDRVGAGTLLFAAMFNPSMGPKKPSIQWAPGALSLGVKLPEPEADHFPLYSGKFKNAYVFQMSSWCAPIKHRGNFTVVEFEVITMLVMWKLNDISEKQIASTVRAASKRPVWSTGRKQSSLPLSYFG